MPSPVAGSRNISADQASYAGLVPGDILDGRFWLTERINHGGMATVFKAEDIDRQRQPVVVKVPHAQYASGVGAWSRFEREAELGAILSHPGIVRFLPIQGSARGTYVVTEYLTGITLAERLAVVGRLPEAEALPLASQITAALQYLHEKGIVHGDIKPGNIMLCADGSSRLIDFGMAQPVDKRRFHFGGSAPAMGTKEYIAPEQLQRQHGRPSADIYSLGATLYQMLTGVVPFPDDDPFVLGSVRLTGDPVAPRKLQSALSPTAEEIVLRAMRRDPAQRYPSAAAMQADLDAPARVRLSGLCDRLQPSTRWRRLLRQGQWIALYCLLPLAMQAALFFWIWWHYRPRHF